MGRRPTPIPDGFDTNATALYAAGAPIRVIADRLGVAPHVVHRALTRQGHSVAGPGRPPGRAAAAGPAAVGRRRTGRAGRAAHGGEVHDYSDHLRGFAAQPDRGSLVPWPAQVPRPTPEP